MATLDIKSNSFDCSLVCIYRPPYSEKNKTSNSLFLREFNDLVSVLKQRKKSFFITGDFNIHLDNLSDTHTKHFNSICSLRDLNQLVTQPTQRCGHILEPFLIQSEFDKVSRVSVLDKAISDHYLILVDFSVEKPERVKQLITSRNLRSLDITSFGENIEKTLLSYSSVTADSLNNSLMSQLDQHAPLRTRTVTVRSHSPWFTDDIKDAKRAQRRAERKWRKTGLQIHKDIFKIKRDATVSLIKECKKMYFMSKFENVKSCKEMFQITDDLLGKLKTSPLPEGNDIENCQKFATFVDDKIDKIRSFLDSQPSPAVLFF